MQPINPANVGEKYICPICSKEFTEKRSVDRHIENLICQNTTSKKELRKTSAETQKIILEMKELLEANRLEMQANRLERQNAVETIKRMETSLVPREPLVNNHNLNVLCLGSNDNLLDILSSREGLHNALTFMKGCALARLSGDCRILQKAYQLETEQAAIMYVNKSKTKFVYYDERQRRTVESNAKILAKKLADILQRSYLKGMESFRTSLSGDNIEGGRDKPEIEAYDLHLWNEHIHELRDELYQKKMLAAMKIHQEPARE